MKTERDIIYTILDILRAGEISNDERLTERFLRDLLRKYRADGLRKHYKGGRMVDSEVFQYITIELEYIANNEYAGTLPKIIRFKNNLGFEVNINGYQIPITNPQDYYYSNMNFNSRFLPKGKTEGQKITVFIGDDTSSYVSNGSATENAILAMKLSIEENGALVLNMGAVLQNPSDDPNYDWDTDVYPYPAERIDELISQIMVKEFRVIYNAKPDEIQNARPDNIRYHDQDDVTQN